VKVPAPGAIVKQLVQAVASFVADGAVTSTLLSFISAQQSEQGRLPSAEEQAQLTELERSEYQAFPSATRCFYGLLDAKMRTEQFVGHNNYGYDDSEGNYQVKAGDHLAYRLEVRDLLGWGSFGAVYKCWDHYKKRNCAVKICRHKASISSQVTSELETLLLLRSQAKTLSRRMSIMSLANDRNGQRKASEVGGGAARSLSLLEAATSSASASSGDREGQGECPAVEFGQAHNCVTMQESFVFRRHRCLVFQSFGLNLYEYLKSVQFAGMGLGQVRKVALQLLKALRHLKSLGIVHCDVKPENVLLKGDPRGGSDDSGMEVVLCDFGSASYAGGSFPSYVQSRYYRAPEVVLRLRSNQRDHRDASSPTVDAPVPAYGFEVDMWSLAAMLPELRTGNVCFPAESEHDLFACHCEVLGMPPSSLLGRVEPSLAEALVEKGGPDGGYTLKPALSTSPLGNPRTVGGRRIARIARARKTDASFVDFLTRSLAWDPTERLTVENAAGHDWITKINLHQHHKPGLAARRSPDTAATQRPPSI
jgi:serine/threonine protein kinase